MRIGDLMRRQGDLNEWPPWRFVAVYAARNGSAATDDVSAEIDRWRRALRTRRGHYDPIGAGKTSIRENPYRELTEQYVTVLQS